LRHRESDAEGALAAGAATWTITAERARYPTRFRDRLWLSARLRTGPELDYRP
jgi:hypothetical protein